MLEGTTNRDRIIAAALRLAETRGWRDLSLGEIAAEAHDAAYRVPQGIPEQRADPRSLLARDRSGRY